MLGHCHHVYPNWGPRVGEEGKGSPKSNELSRLQMPKLRLLLAAARATPRVIQMIQLIRTNAT